MVDFINQKEITSQFADPGHNAFPVKNADAGHPVTLVKLIAVGNVESADIFAQTGDPFGDLRPAVAGVVDVETKSHGVGEIFHHLFHLFRKFPDGAPGAEFQVEGHLMFSGGDSQSFKGVAQGCNTAFTGLSFGTGAGMDGQVLHTQRSGGFDEVDETAETEVTLKIIFLGRGLA